MGKGTMMVNRKKGDRKTTMSAGCYYAAGFSLFCKNGGFYYRAFKV